MTFDPVTHAFGTVITANYPDDGFAVNPVTDVLIDRSDASGAGTVSAVDLTGLRACTLTDSGLADDEDGPSTDSSTDIIDWDA